MKISNTMLAALVPAMVSLAPVAAHATAPTVTVFNSTALGFGGDVVLTINGVDYTAFNSGHYDNLGGSIFTNYQAGFDGFNNNPLSEVRNFFAFDLSGLTGPITSATLTIPSNPFGIGYNNTSGSASITYTNWDVSTPIDDLNDGTNGLSTFADLGSGEKFGSALVHDGDLVTTVTSRRRRARGYCRCRREGLRHRRQRNGDRPRSRGFDLGDDDRRLRPDGRCASSSYEDHRLRLRSRASILRAPPVERAAAFSYRGWRARQDETGRLM